MFTDQEIETLTQIAGLIIPPSEAYDIPGANDPAIMAEVLKSAARDEHRVRVALAAFVDADPTTFQTDHPTHAETLQTIVASCYYRDPRVLASLGRAPQPPFPKGHDLPKSDWSLLDPVRARAPFWRRV